MSFSVSGVQQAFKVVVADLDQIAVVNQVIRIVSGLILESGVIYAELS